MGGMGALEGASFAGSVMVFPSSKGSTMWCITLDLTCRNGHAPMAFINSRLDPFVVLGAVLQEIPMVLIEDLSVFDSLEQGHVLTVNGDEGTVELS